MTFVSPAGTLVGRVDAWGYGGRFTPDIDLDDVQENFHAVRRPEGVADFHVVIPRLIVAQVGKNQRRVGGAGKVRAVEPPLITQRR